MKQLLAQYMKWRWGVVGALKPPLAPLSAFILEGFHDSGLPYPWNKRNHPRWVAWVVPTYVWYRWRKFCWRIESDIYLWTGLPERWHKWYCAEMGLPR